MTVPDTPLTLSVPLFDPEADEEGPDCEHRDEHAEDDARSDQIGASERLTRTLQVLAAQIRELEAEIAQALDAHPDGPIFRSFFCSPEAVICAATLLAEIGDCRRRHPQRDAIAADGGQAPVAVESGKRKNAKFRWACNKRLRNALGTLAFNSRRWNAWAADRYANARARGHSHRRALRTLGRAWSRIIWRCWQTRTPYDPARHTPAAPHHRHHPTRPTGRQTRRQLTLTRHCLTQDVFSRTLSCAPRACVRDSTHRRPGEGGARAAKRSGRLTHDARR